MHFKTANPNFFIVKIAKEAQQQKRTGVSETIIKRAETFSFGKSGLQCGEVVAIGAFAKIVIPSAKIGGTLVFSWKVEYNGDDNEKTNMALIHEDELSFYYTVTISEYKGRDAETYAYFDENGLITHPSFVILEQEKEEQRLTELTSGLVLIDNYQLSDDEIRQKIEFNTQWIYSLSITYNIQSQTRESDARQTKAQMEGIQKENAELSKMLQKKEKFDRYKIIYCNPLHQVKEGDEVFAHNIFCLEPLEVNNKEYIISRYHHLGVAI